MPSLLAAMPSLPIPQHYLLYGGIGAGVVFVLFLVVLFRGKPRHDPDAGLDETLGSFPAPPPPGDRVLKVMGHPVRLRLVVVAPTGKKTVGKVDAVLEQVLRGLGEAAIDDKPRVRIWPAQLSNAGFAPAFFRHTRRPEPEGAPSRWILLAGPARAGGVPVLLGLAVLADRPSKAGSMPMTETSWGEVLSVE
ncbi:MAG: hypothetical protein K2W96_09495 [Gemmataceae bacterium]|nr:hypothetical protein [Gemmataceae bacterium]